MADVRVRFIAALRMDSDTVAFRVEVTNEVGETCCGFLHARHPASVAPEVLYSAEFPTDPQRKLSSAVTAALAGPYRSTPDMRAEEAIECGAVAIVTIPEPPGPGYRCVRVLWESGTDSDGIIVTFRDAPLSVRTARPEQPAPAGGSLLAQGLSSVKRWLKLN